MTPLLPRGAPVAMVAPAGIHDPDRLDAGLALARARGVDVRALPGMLQPHRYLAGDDDHRAEQLIEALTDPRWAGVWISRGGYGLTRILDRLEGVELGNKPIIGFSDVTALFAALHPRGLGPLIHGPVVHSLPITDDASLEHLFDLLAGRETAPLEGTPWVDGTAEGWLCGGNLCLLATLCGTPWQLDVSGAILVLEDVGEYAFRLDRMLQQLRSAGALEGVAGIAVGTFEGCRVPGGADYTLRDVLLDHLGTLGVPVIGDLPIGHGAANRAFAWGAAASLRDGRLAWG